MNPLISVIIPTYNRAHLLGETLNSVIAQTYSNWECLVVDDGSTDYTKELLEFYQAKDSRISYYVRPHTKKKGANACRNYGFKLSNGQYINWFDDDDLMHPEKLEIQMQALTASDYKFSVCQSEVFDDQSGKSLGLRHNKISTPTPFQDYLKMNIIWLTQAPLWKRDFLESQNLYFDEKLKAAQEWEFHCRILNVLSEYHTTEKPLVQLRKHSHSITYGQSDHNKSWNYFLARCKIYRNQELMLDGNSMDFLRKYLLNTFKGMVRNKNPFTIHALVKFILPEKRMSIGSKFYAFLSIISYKVLGKGNNIHQKIRF